MPEIVTAEATTAEGAPITLTPALPVGMEFAGCSVAGTPVEPDAVFPVGESGLLCNFTTGQPGAGMAVVRVQVTAATPVPEQNLFTSAPETAAEGERMLDSPMTWVWIGGAGVLVVAGLIAFIATRRRQG